MMDVSLQWPKNLRSKRFAKRSAYYIVMILESDHWNVPALPRQRSEEISHSIVLKNQLRPFFYLLFQCNEIFPFLFVFYCVCVCEDWLFS